jgi:hypothetical protein
MAWFTVEFVYENNEVRTHAVPAWDAVEAVAYATDLLPNFDPFEGPKVVQVKVAPVG